MSTKYLKLLPIAAALLFGVFSARGQTPGGVTNANYNWMVWLTPDSYAAGTWTNKITTGASVGNFSRLRNPSGTLTGTNAAVGAGFNFQPAVQFKSAAVGAAPNQMESWLPFTINTGEAFTIFFVANRGESPSANVQDYILGYGTSNTTGGVWWTRPTANSDAFNIAWNPATARALGTNKSGLIGIDVPNANPSTINWYVNGGTGGSLAVTGAAAAGTHALPIRIGSNRTNVTTGQRGFNGDIQEIIVFKRNNANALVAADVQKIHSYLAIKYGFSIPTPYIYSAGTNVWDNTYTGYNNNVFGIGRDDATGLNQVQSRSLESDFFTVYKGALNDLNNNTPNDAVLTDKSFVMLGSNNTPGNTSYTVPATAFQSGSIDPGVAINYRSNTVYRAQVTNNGVTGAGQSHVINFKAVSASVLKPRYLLVSSVISFAPADTRVYPLVNDVATNVTVNHGDFITVIGYESKPGGVVTGSYTWLAWLIPDEYADGTWKNMITSTGTLGNFSNKQFPSSYNLKNAPKLQGLNYHQGVRFSTAANTAAPNYMESLVNFNIAATESYTMFVVVEKRSSRNGTASGTRDHILGYGTGTPTGLAWHSSSPNLYLSWPPATAAGNQRLLGDISVGLITVDNVNTTALTRYLNGVSGSITSANSSVNNLLRIGSARGTNPGQAGLNGTIQEIILLKRNGTGAQLNATDMQKIQSYLAIKYGISLNTTATAGAGYDYMNSAGTVVWNSTTNSGFNFNIFGIGRDDASGLYQKQSSSLNNSSLAVYLGGTNRMPALNNNNTGTLDDKQFLMLGANSSKRMGTLTLDIPTGTEYENGFADATNGYNIQSAAMKAQLTGLTSITVRFTAPSNDFSHILVSKTDQFTDGAAGGTKIYTISPGDRTVEVVIDEDYKFIKFIGFAPGPGGVTNGLKLWLRADDESTIDIELTQNKTVGGKLEGYPEGTADDILPGVAGWHDLARGHSYTWAAGPTSGAALTNHRIPVMKYFSPEMNYNPAVRFWASGNTYSAYLSNRNGILPTAHPVNGTHQAFFMVNNNFGTNAWIYNLSFRDYALSGTIPGPGYGVEQASGSRVVGRFRTGGVATGTKDLFKAGATSILSYKSMSNDRMYYRFNGIEDDASFSWGAASGSSADFRSASILGTGYDYNRTIIGVMSEAILFDRALTATEQELIESYMAFKYGITLEPSSTTFKRFDYKFSSGNMIWQGNQASGPFVDYYNNVAAVIRDDAAKLNQRHSHSTNVGSLLHLGVARPEGEDTYLSDDGTGVGSLDDMQAIAFGSDSRTDFTEVLSPEECGDFRYRFNRTWLVNNVTGHPIKLLVGAQNNASLTIGNDADVIPYYNVLNPGFDIALIVASSYDSIVAGNYRYTGMMEIRNGEHQTAYTFPPGLTYITFGYKENRRGCYGVLDFVYDKIFRWTAWTPRLNNTAPYVGPKTITGPTVDLGDDIFVAQSVTYGAGVGMPSGYPRTVAAPSQGSLQIRRRGNNAQGDVTMKMTFTDAVLPRFQISGLDGPAGAYDEVEIYGSCGGASRFMPRLSTQNNNPTYKISGNKATVNRRGSVSATNARGILNVRFSAGVSEVYVVYRLKNTRSNATRFINISPVTIAKAPPKPQPDEFGMTFSKAALDELSICSDQEFIFEITNGNCVERFVNLRDTLPENMVWLKDRIGLDGYCDSINKSNLNPSYKLWIEPAEPGRGEILCIDSLRVPANTEKSNSGFLELTAYARADENMAPGSYENQAFMTYFTEHDPPKFAKTPSSNWRTGVREPTPFTFLDGVPAKEVVISDSYSQTNYRENNVITVTYTIENPNDYDIPSVYKDIMFNDEFKYVAGSFTATGGIAPVPVLVQPLDEGGLSIAGHIDGDDGFTIPANGTVTISFKLLAPPETGLVYELDETTGLPISEIPIDLCIEYFLYSGTDDPCLARAVGQNEVKCLPFRVGPMGVISNTNVTSTIK